MSNNQEPRIEVGINPKDYFKDVKHIIIYAFSIGDRHYFRFDDFLNMPYDRALKALVYFKELDMNCDRDFLKLHTMAVDNILTRPTINIDTLVELKKLNDQLKQRLELPKDNDLMYKMAAVTFFDQHENPYTYEFKYGENKIKHWKKNVSLSAFFLQKPLMELIPYLQYAGENLEMFSQMITNENEEHIKKMLAQLSEEQKTKLPSKFSSFLAH